MPQGTDSVTLNGIVQSMRQTMIQTGPADAALRRDRLTRSMRLILDNRDALATAMSADFGHRSLYQTLAADAATTAKSLAYASQNVDVWMQAEAVGTGMDGVTASIVPQPLGVVGVIAPWNFPINLSFGPLAGVFAAGNVALLKPSELTPRTSELIAELVGRYFSPMELGVVLGDASVGTAFSALPFDHLVFTGSTTVGRHVMRAAAENLVPVTLELGGKSPVVIDRDADIAMAAERTLTVKTFNAGQICLSPDYVMLAKDRIGAFVEAARTFMQSAFPTVQSNADYTSIVSERHFDRLIAMIADAEAKGAQVISLAPSGEPGHDRTTRKIAPTLIIGGRDDMMAMQEEIFGPVLPIRTTTDLAEALAYINAHPRPLAAYYFGHDADRQQQFARGTTSGALVINDVMTHASIESLPFGGVGASGIGAYHGVHGFRRFSHARPVVWQAPEGASGLRLRAPYAEKLPVLQAMLSN
ncbi:coniferyl aldehyde dehydrogenase [Novosphingobium sp. 9]|uniref:coniferyl aldehyde dehydrogenase n=1 Tax=Novosphingobium sp. 9 TaxID=2025349 RepID=UPI0021B54D73|nr:coniferyl aldehyde dehydrogenase [Novosphingobium sp. 9]